MEERSWKVAGDSRHTPATTLLRVVGGLRSATAEAAKLKPKPVTWFVQLQ